METGFDALLYMRELKRGGRERERERRRRRERTISEDNKGKLFC